MGSIYALWYHFDQHRCWVTEYSSGEAPGILERKDGATVLLLTNQEDMASEGRKILEARLMPRS